MFTGHRLRLARHDMSVCPIVFTSCHILDPVRVSLPLPFPNHCECITYMHPLLSFPLMMVTVWRPNCYIGYNYISWLVKSSLVIVFILATQSCLDLLMP